MAMHDDLNRTYAKSVIGKNYLPGAGIGDCAEADARAMKPLPRKPVDVARETMAAALDRLREVI